MTYIALHFIHEPFARMIRQPHSVLTNLNNLRMKCTVNDIYIILYHTPYFAKQWYAKCIGSLI